MEVPDSREVLAGVSHDAGTLSSTEVLQPFCQIAQQVGAGTVYQFKIGFGVSVFELSRRVIAGLDVESLFKSRVNDVGDALALELEETVDNPGTTIGTLFSVLHWILWFVRCKQADLQKRFPMYVASSVCQAARKNRG